MTTKPVRLEAATGLPPDGPHTCAAKYALMTIEQYLIDGCESDFQYGYMAAMIAIYRECCLGGSFDSVHPDEPRAVSAADLLLDPQARDASRH
jgi:hypothetical protein